VQAVRAAQGWVGDGDWVDRESLDEHGGKISRAEGRKFGWDIWPDESERGDGKVMPNGERSGDQGCGKEAMEEFEGEFNRCRKEPRVRA
jgi:hypothetical protein